MKAANKTEFGDFQTPLPLAQDICSLLFRLGEHPEIVIEPTVGRGAFLIAAARQFADAQLHGYEINCEHLVAAAEGLERARASARTNLSSGNFFEIDWAEVTSAMPGRLLILGNPPWVTSAAVSALNGSNLPVKQNILGLRGLDARTGKANFDISEWMLIRLLQAIGRRPATIAVLCKTATARKTLLYAWRNDLPVEDAALYRIDAALHFSASVDACLLFFRVGTRSQAEARVYASLVATKPESTIGLVGKNLVSDIIAYRKLQHLEGLCRWQWRSGIKHDCAQVVELRPFAGNSFSNGLGESVELEPDHLFPLLKCTDLANNSPPSRVLLVTQKGINGSQATIGGKSPKTWTYLHRHLDRFRARKSSIYRNRADFSFFGVGPYTFLPWKVAVSALHRDPKFRVVGPRDNKPVVFDDACYYVSFDDEATAELIADTLNSELARAFLLSLSFRDAKRPVTTEVLQRLNIANIAEEAGFGPRWRALLDRPAKVTYEERVAQTEFAMERPTISETGSGRGSINIS